MSASARLALVMGIAVSLLLGASASLAQDEPVTTSQEGEAPPDAEPISEEPEAPATVPEPAVPVVEAEEVEEGPGAPFVYLAPTALVVGAGAVIFTVIMYFLKVTRARYRVEQ